MSSPNTRPLGALIGALVLLVALLLIFDADDNGVKNWTAIVVLVLLMAFSVFKYLAGNSLTKAARSFRWFRMLLALAMAITAGYLACTFLACKHEGDDTLRNAIIVIIASALSAVPLFITSAFGFKAEEEDALFDGSDDHYNSEQISQAIKDNKVRILFAGKDLGIENLTADAKRRLFGGIKRMLKNPGQYSNASILVLDSETFMLIRDTPSTKKYEEAVRDMWREPSDVGANDAAAENQTFRQISKAILEAATNPTHTPGASTSRSLVSLITEKYFNNETRQHDASEFLSKFLENMAAYDSGAAALFRVTVQTTTKCAQGDANEVSESADVDVLTLPLGDQPQTIQEILASWSEEKEDPDLRSESPCDGRRIIKKEQLIEPLPSYLFIALDRRRLDGTVSNTSVNIQEQISIPGEINYELLGYTKYSGGGTSGHYVSVVKHGGSWKLINDATISDFTLPEQDTPYILLFKKQTHVQYAVSDLRGLPNFDSNCFFNAPLQLVMRTDLWNVVTTAANELKSPA